VPEKDPLLVHAGSARKRDAYKVATAGLTGITAFGALAVTGVVAGTAAHDKAVQDATESVRPPAQAAPVVAKRRKHRTIVRTTVVHAVSGTGVTSTGTGGTVRSPATSGSGTVSHSAPATHAAPAPKPAAPAPAPAPSSGS